MNLYEDKFRFLNYNLKKYNWRLLLLVIIATILGLFVIESAADGYAKKTAFRYGGRPGWTGDSFFY